MVEEHGVPIGYRCVVVHDDHVWLDELAVVPDARGRGIGSWLMREVMDGAATRGLPVRLSALVRNQPALELYERLGFWMTHVEPPRAYLEWFSPISPRPLDQPREEAELLAALDAGDHAGVDAALYYMLRAVSHDGVYTPDGCVGTSIGTTSRTTIDVRGQVAEIVTRGYAYDPFRATIELSADGASIAALTLYWGDAATGLGAGSSDGTRLHPVAQVRDWLYVFHKSRIIAR